MKNLVTNAHDEREREILVLGDSHTTAFSHPLIKEKFQHCFFNVLTVIGATASGLENLNSTTKAYLVFREAVQESTTKLVVVMLGEVDTSLLFGTGRRNIRNLSLL